MDEDRIRYAFSRARNKDDLDRLFRALSKRTHPDLAGGTGEAFVTLKREYEAALKLLSGHQAPGTQEIETGAAENFDPYAVIAEMGFSSSISPRAALYISFYRYQAARLGVRKIRTSPALRKRNIAIIRTILHWARIYDPEFSEAFLSYDRPRVHGLKPTEFHRADADVRHRLEAAFSNFMEYQEFGRPMSKLMTRRSLEDTAEMAERYHLEQDGIAGIASWLLRELEKAPCLNVRR